MKKNWIRCTGAILLTVVWLGLTLAAWLHPAQDVSDSERRKLAQFPDLSMELIKSGSFMSKFEDYTLDQFPLRDSFRQLKSLFHFSALQQKDNNDIYIADGYAAQLEYPLNETSVENAIEKFHWIYETYLSNSGSRIFLTMVPDKGYYLAEANGYPAMDYDTMFRTVQAGTPWATYVDITNCLSIEDYYRTDTHWRQEKLLPVAQKLCQAMEVTVPEAADYTQTALERPFYGVYCGQAALPMEAETMYIMENERLSCCIVSNYEVGETTQVYDLQKLNSKDLYDVYLSGAAALLTIENPNATTDRELIVFRDSFGSSLIPLLVQDYQVITLVDIRYLSSASLEHLLSFHGQDVLFLYSTLVLNNSNSLK